MSSNHQFSLFRRVRDLALAALLLVAPPLLLLPIDSAAADERDAEAAYTRTIAERAEKIVGTLGIAEAAQAIRVRDIIARQYRDLRDIHDARDTKLKALRQEDVADKAAHEAALKAAQDEADARLAELHALYLGRLGAELTPLQIDQVKNGMTYGVLPLTYRVYMEMFPNLTDEQKTQIMAWLVEAREHAMDAGTSDDKHKWFGKYKGRINNYLSAAGYDMKKAEREMLERNKRKPAASE
jgi:hypothetical protein